VWWQSGNGAKVGLKRSANKASVAGAAEGQTYRFRPPFLWFISFGGAKEMNNKNFGRTKNRGVHLHDELGAAKEQENFWRGKRTERSELGEAK